MNNTKILCHQVFYTARHISIQATKQFMVHMKNCPGMGGVDLTDEGGGWYSLSPRSELCNGEISSVTDRALFLEFARLDLEEFLREMQAMDMSPPKVTVVPDEPNNHVNADEHKVYLRRSHGTVSEKYTMTVSVPVSSAMKLEQWATEDQVRALARRYKADRHAPPARRDH